MVRHSNILFFKLYLCMKCIATLYFIFSLYVFWILITRLFFYIELWLVGLRHLPHANHDTNNSVESYHDALKRCITKKIEFVSIVFEISIVFHNIYIDEQKFKGFIPNKKLKQLWIKILRKPFILNDDVLQPTFWDNRWIVESQTSTILIQWYFFRVNSFVDYACCSYEHALIDNFCKHQIGIILKFLQDCRESSILKYYRTYYSTKREGFEALCLYSKPYEISDFEEELDEDASGHEYRKQEKHSDTDDDGIKDTLTDLTPKGVALRTK